MSRSTYIFFSLSFLGSLLRPLLAFPDNRGSCDRHCRAHRCAPPCAVCWWSIKGDGMRVQIPDLHHVSIPQLTRRQGSERYQRVAARWSPAGWRHERAQRPDDWRPGRHPYSQRADRWRAHRLAGGWLRPPLCDREPAAFAACASGPVLVRYSSLSAVSSRMRADTPTATRSQTRSSNSR